MALRLDPAFDLTAKGIAATIALDAAALNMFVTRMWRGDRVRRRCGSGWRACHNALVALGAASFVIFSQLFRMRSARREVAAQVVSIGFLGAGIIFRDGFNVHGLNTATLWCSAGLA